LALLLTEQGGVGILPIPLLSTPPSRKQKNFLAVIIILPSSILLNFIFFFKIQVVLMELITISLII
jgi:hypothetical protein